MTPRVKICGITRVGDAELAAELGAAAIGFVLWPTSPRELPAATAREIAKVLPAHVARVGVFVDQPPAVVAELVNAIGLDAVQMHGDRDIGEYRDIRARLIRAMPIETDEAIAAADALPEDITLLVDAADRVKWGGTGRRANWTRAAEIARRRPVILAGGLTPENVREAIDVVHPWAVDVSSGVEESPGIKSADRLRRFFDAVQQ
jgi:phosphoribosylanthranilate isomerase